MNRRENRRDAFRLHDEISLDLIKLDATNLAKALEKFDKKRADFGLLSHLKFDVEKYLPQMRIIERKYPDIAQYLKFLERQIEFLTLHISGSCEISEPKKIAVELSAGGIQFPYSEPCEVGDYFEAAVILYPQETRLLSILKINRIEINSAGDCIVSGEFFQLHDADREAVVKHVHHKQIEELRQKES